MTEQTHPAAPATTPSPTNGLAVASMVVGIVAFISGWIPVWGFLAGATAVVLGIFALRKPGIKGMSITGIVTGGLATLAGLVTIVFWGFALSGLSLLGNEIQNGIQQYETESRAVLDAKKEFVKGETATFDSLELTATAVQRNYIPEGMDATTIEDTEYVLVTVTVENVSDESQYVSASNFDLSLGTGDAYSYYSTTLEAGTLSSKESASGDIVYSIPSGEKSLKLQSQKSIYVQGKGFENIYYTLEI